MTIQSCNIHTAMSNENVIFNQWALNQYHSDYQKGRRHWTVLEIQILSAISMEILMISVNYAMNIWTHLWYTFQFAYGAYVKCTLTYAKYESEHSWFVQG